MKINVRKPRNKAFQIDQAPTQAHQDETGCNTLISHVAPASDATLRSQTSLLSHSNRQYETVVSSCGDSEGDVKEKACPSRLPCIHCADVLHELSNVMTGVLANAQLLGWRLPPYSHLKRPVREVERNAQRGGELLKRLMRRLAEDA